jgi:hypothetical protein
MLVLLRLQLRVFRTRIAFWLMKRNDTIADRESEQASNGTRAKHGNCGNAIPFPASRGERPEPTGRYLETKFTMCGKQRRCSPVRAVARLTRSQR